MLIRAGSTCLFFSQTRVHDTILLPEVLKLRIHISIPDFKRQSLKDNFHNSILGIDRMLPYGIVDSTIPLNFFVSRGGDRWRKTFRTPS